MPCLEPNRIIKKICSPGLVLAEVAGWIGQTDFIARGAAALPTTLYPTGTDIINTSRQIGAAIGVAVFVAVADIAQQPGQFQNAWLLMAALA